MEIKRKFLKVIKALFLLYISLSFASCITINRTREPHYETSNIDPVCGVQVETSTALKTYYNGRTYYFDSEECQKVFLKNPDKFVGNQSAHHGNNMGHMGWNTMGHMDWLGGAVIASIMAIAMTSMIVFGAGR